MKAMTVSEFGGPETLRPAKVADPAEAHRRQETAHVMGKIAVHVA
jgi:hypothetical protein